MNIDLSYYMGNKDPFIQKISVSHIDYSADHAYKWSKAKENCCLINNQEPNDEQIRLFKKKLKHINAMTNSISELNENHLDFISNASDWTYIYALMIYKYPVGDKTYQDFRNNINIMIKAIDYIMNNQKLDQLHIFSLCGSKQFGIIIDVLKKIDILQHEDQLNQYMKNKEVAELYDSYFYKLFIKSKKRVLMSKLEIINKQSDYLLFKRSEGLIEKNELIEILFEELHQINMPVDVKSKILMQFVSEI